MVKTPEDECKVRGVLEQLCKSWAEGNAALYAEQFTEDAYYIAFFGGVYRGRKEIFALHELLFKKVLKGTKLYMEILEIRFLNTSTALAITRGDTGKRTPRYNKKIQSYILIQQEGSWKIVLFQNTKKSRFMEILMLAMTKAPA